jgi:ribose transport system permease protein
MDVSTSANASSPGAAPQQPLDTRAPAPGHEAPPRPEPADGGWSAVAALLGRFSIPVLLVALVVAFSIAKPDSFATVDNLRAILDNQTVVVLLAVGIMLPLIVGELDLSGAQVLSFASVLVVGLIAKQGLHPYVAIAVTIPVGALIGLVNGLVVAKLKVPAFVATLGMATLLAGLSVWYTGSRAIVDPQPRYFTQLARGHQLGVPLPVVYAAAVTLIVWVVLSFLPIGRRMYATGGNRRAAQLAGIDVDRYTIASFVAAGGLAAIGGVILGARLGSATAGTGTDLLFPAITGTFLGATTVRPGRLNVVGTVVSVYALAVTVSGLQHLGAEPWVEPVFNGSALIIAVALSGWAFHARAERARRRQLAQLVEGPPQRVTGPATEGLVTS